MVQERRWSEAEADARRRLSVVEREHGPRSPEAADVLDLLVRARVETVSEADPELRELAERALSIRKELKGPDHVDLLPALRNLSMVHRKQKDEQLQAGEYLVQALEIGRRHLGAAHPEVLSDEIALGGILIWGMGTHAALKEARTLLERNVAAVERLSGPTSSSVAASLHFLSSALWRLGRFDEGLAGYLRCLKIAEQNHGAQSPNVISALNSIGNTYWMLGDYADALKYHERARAVEQKTLPPEHFWHAQTLSSIGSVQLSLGEYREAKASFEALLAKSPKFTGALLCLGHVHRALGDNDAAKRYYEKFLAAIEKEGQPGSGGPLSVQAWAGLARLEHAQGHLDAARSYYERCLPWLEEAQQDFFVASRDVLDGLAQLHVETGNYAEARRVLDRALEFHRKVFGADSPRVAETLSRVARLELLSGDPAAALTAALRAEEISREQMRLAARGLAETQALRYGTVRTSGMDALLAAVSEVGDTRPDLVAQAWDALVRSRALVFDEMSARHKALGASSDPKVGRLAERLHAARAQLAKLMVRGPADRSPEVYQADLAEARGEQEQAERALADGSEVFASQYAHDRIGLREALRRLPEDGALVAFAVYRESARPRGAASPAGETSSYLALVVRPESADRPAVVGIGPADSIEAAVSAWRKQAALPGSGGAAEEAYRAAAESLRRIVWDPLASKIAGAKRVFVVPDGVLHLVNFAALPAPDGSYMVEAGPLLHLLSTERDLALATGPRSSSQGLVALGRPDYDAAGPFAALASPPDAAVVAQTASADASAVAFRGSHAGCKSFAALRFDALPETGEEIDEVAGLWEAARSGEKRGTGGVLELLGPAATETAFKVRAPHHRVLHVATHGFFLGDECTPPALDAPRRGIGGLAVSEDQPATPASDENPLLLSGLVFAGANHRASAGPGEDDGILTAEEIGALDLSGVEWAVLSACDTGVGQVRAGEGVFGLRRAFQVAGARTLIMSLWPVDDESARQWMKALYEGRFSRGLDTAEAVRDASLEVLRSRQARGMPTHPFYWAAFVAAGDWR